MLESLQKDYITTARSKGLEERRVLFYHALKNAVGPVVVLIGMRIGFLLSGTVLIETVFGWPGIGRLMNESIATRDYPILMGLFLIISTTVILSNLVTDIILATVDPRIRYE
jgi:peptide/nickel transport system permease protein